MSLEKFYHSQVNLDDYLEHSKDPRFSTHITQLYYESGEGNMTLRISANMIPKNTKDITIMLILITILF